MSVNQDRRAARLWLEAHYPMDHTRGPYDPDAALELLGLREQGIQHDDIIAWVYPSQEAAAMYARANERHWGHPSLGVAIDGNGEIVGVTDLRPALELLRTGSGAGSPAGGRGPGEEHGPSASAPQGRSGVTIPATPPAGRTPGGPDDT